MSYRVVNSSILLITRELKIIPRWLSDVKVDLHLSLFVKMTLQESTLQEVLPIGHFEASSEDQEAFNEGPDTTSTTSDGDDKNLNNANRGVSHQKSMNTEGND
jgi:hypothetical protein